MIPGFASDESGLARMTGIVLGKVVDVHPENNSVDVRCFSDGRRLVSVPVAGLGNSGTTGLVDLPVPDLTTGRDEDAKWESGNTDQRDIMAVVAFANGSPVCLGFVCPPITEMTFQGDDAEERRLYRHASDWYTLLDKAANMEVAHPSGTWLAMTETPQKTRLTQQDYDKKWQVKRNLARAVHGIISWWNGDKKERAQAHVTPDGALDVWLNEQLNVEVGNDRAMAASLSINQDGDIGLTSASHVGIAVGAASHGGEGFKATPSFQPSDAPDGEIYGYDGAGGPMRKTDTAIIHLDGGGTITIRATAAGVVNITASTAVNISAPKITLNGEVYVSGNVHVSGNIDASGKIIDGGGNTNHHSH